jgi:hypothetical protein
VNHSLFNKSLAELSQKLAAGSGILCLALLGVAATAISAPKFSALALIAFEAAGVAFIHFGFAFLLSTLLVAFPAKIRDFVAAWCAIMLFYGTISLIFSGFIVSRHGFNMIVHYINA